MTVPATVRTPAGDARFRAFGAADAPATVVLGHGAGGGFDRAPDLAWARDACLAAGAAVVEVDQPWLVAGRRLAPGPASLDAAWAAVLDALAPRGPLILGGRSAGARVACRAAPGAVHPVAGVLALAFPLHPPGAPARSRAAELAGALRAGIPCAVVQGGRDPFGTAIEVRAAVPGASVTEVPGADHGFAFRAADREAALRAPDLVAGACAALLRQAGVPAGPE